MVDGQVRGYRWGELQSGTVVESKASAELRSGPSPPMESFWLARYPPTPFICTSRVRIRLFSPAFYLRKS